MDSQIALMVSGFFGFALLQSYFFQRMQLQMMKQTSKNTQKENERRQRRTEQQNSLDEDISSGRTLPPQ